MTKPDDRRWTNRWWGRRTTTVNVTIVVAVVLFCLWKAFFP